MTLIAVWSWGGRGESRCARRPRSEWPLQDHKNSFWFILFSSLVNIFTWKASLYCAKGRFGCASWHAKVIYPDWCVYVFGFMLINIKKSWQDVSLITCAAFIHSLKPAGCADAWIYGPSAAELREIPQSHQSSPACPPLVKCPRTRVNVQLWLLYMLIWPERV